MFYSKLFLAIFCFMLLTHRGSAQVTGCKDPAATNYNASATINDGSCVYSTTAYTPTLIDTLSAKLPETSGLQMAGNFLWSFNDGGTSPAIYRVDTLNGAVLQTVVLDGVTNVDWEDMAFDGTHFYIGDFGNNADGARTDLKIYKFPFSAIAADYTSNPSVTINAADITAINFNYADQAPVVATTANNTKYDCEAMIVADGKIHLFTKNWLDLTTTHYVINSTSGGNYSATPVETLSTNYLVTGADISPNGKLVVLLGYQTTGFASHFLHLLSDFNSGLFFNGNKRKINLPSAITMGQAEGICFASNDYGYISNEYFSATIAGITITVDQRLRSFATTAFSPAYVLPVRLIDFSVAQQGKQHRLSWNFSESVPNVEVLRSVDGSGFSILQKHVNSRAQSVLVDASAGMSCYQLKWKEENGSLLYSSIHCLNSLKSKPFTNLFLTADGKMQFQSNESGIFSMRLLNVQGQMLRQLQRHVTKGINTLSFPGQLNPGSLVVLQMIGPTKVSSSIIMVATE